MTLKVDLIKRSCGQNLQMLIRNHVLQARSRNIDQYQPTTLWQFIEVLTDDQQSNSIRVTFQQCKKDANCSKQQLQGQSNQSSTDGETRAKRTEEGSASCVRELRPARKKKKLKNGTLHPPVQSDNAEDMLFVKVTFFSVFFCTVPSVSKNLFFGPWHNVE